MVTFWKNMISSQIGKLDKEKSMVLLPIAAIEQHGGHLPVGTDSLILEALLERFANTKEFKGYHVIIAPQLWVGKSNEHLGFPGTISYTAITLYNMLKEMVDSMVKSGFKKVMLTNSHGGNTDLLNLISRDLRIEYGIDVYVFDWWFTPFWQELLATEKESPSPYGVFHACELETSLMMAINPDLVDKNAITDETPDEKFQDMKYLSLFGPVNMGWKTRDVTKSGVIGSPSYATAEKGEKMLQYATDKLEAIVAELLGFQY